VHNAFVLGAGLGTRLKSLTEQLPKPMIPVFGRPLIEYAFEHLADAGLRRFVVNTHHRAEEYTQHFPDGHYRNLPITFRHEPVLLETGGGIDNVADLLAGSPFIVYNGDILTDLPLAPLLETHAASGAMVTLALRSEGAANHVALSPATGRISDIRNLLGSGDPGSFQFTGIYACQPEFLNHLRHGEKHSVIPIFLELIKAGQLGGTVLDGGNWWDLGTRDAYLDAHLAIAGSPFPRYQGEAAYAWQQAVSEGAELAEGVKIDPASAVGKGAKIGIDASLKNCVVWEGGKVQDDASLNRCIVRRGQSASGELTDTDV
jgi:mannose-1-phosphate guanylyltransferase